VALFILGLSLATILGCQKDEISHYQVPRLEIPLQPKQAGASGPLRMITAIFPQPDRTWFFKLTGLPEEVDKHKGEFEHFLQSVRFTKKGNPPVTWTVPEGWHREAGAGLRFASFRFGTAEHPLELTVTPLGAEAGTLLDNVNRWRGQLSLKPIDEADLNKLIQEFEVDGVKAMMVDLTGTGSGKASMSPPFAKAHPPIRKEDDGQRDPGRLPFTYRAPQGWKEVPADGRITLAAFDAGEGSQMARVTITAAGGALAENVNRWRSQVGLGPVSDEQIARDCRPIDVDRIRGQHVDLTGPESAGGMRILAVLAEQGDATWFFKMRGPADVVGRQKAAFEAFIGSVRFTGG
jgi:hypothetical protein